MKYTIAGRLARALLLGQTVHLSIDDLEALERFRQALPPHSCIAVTDGANGWWYDRCQITNRMYDCVDITLIPAR